MWDGLALVKRDSVNFINEPHVTGGNPVLAGNSVMFNDMLGSTLAVDGKSVDMTAFGDSDDAAAMFTGKPLVEELGHVFLFRNYRAELGKWQTADPLGYPDGWNQLAYCNNGVINNVDVLGLSETWIQDNVRYVANVSLKNLYGIIYDDSPGDGICYGNSYIAVWEIKTHAVCLTCSGPDCSTGQCYNTYSDVTVHNGSWMANRPIATPVLSLADLIAYSIGLMVEKLTQSDKYWPISADMIANYNAPGPPTINKVSFLGKHCE